MIHRIKILLSLAILFPLIIGCSKKPSPKKYIAKVGNSYLLKNMVDTALQKPGNRTQHREEFIRNWVETEMLFKEAKSQNITNETEYKALVVKMKRELAVAMLLQISGRKNFTVNTSALLNYFNLNKYDFRNTDDAVVVNYIKFNNEQGAIKFRNLLLNTNWENAISNFKNDSTLVDYSSGKYLRYYEITPPILLRYIKNLNPGEIGIVLKTSPDNFVVVQITAFIKKGEVPKFIFIKKIVKQRYLMTKRKKALRDYINKLYSKYDVEIKKGN